VEVCPYDALFWAPEYSYAEPGLRELTQERDTLAEWLTGVPPTQPG
jgi:NADH-quinone oxidoreductase subunit I